jgi:hypothetical protein
MRALIVHPATEGTTLDALGQAFAAAMDRNGGPAVAVVMTVVALGVIVGLVRWALHEDRRHQGERRAREARRREVEAAAPATSQRREWVRVAGRLPLTVRHAKDGKAAWYEDCETLNVSGGGVAFLSRAPPPPGVPVEFTLDLGEKPILALKGVVTRSKPAPPGALALVALKIERCPAGMRERIVRWVAHAGERELVKMRRGRPCAACGRPLAGEDENVHSTCAPREAPAQTHDTPG